MTSGSDGDAPRLASRLTAPSGPRDRWPAGVATLALLGAFGLAAGPLGVLVGVATAVVWYGLGAPYAIAVGHLLLVPVFPAGVDAGSLALVAGGFLALLLAPAVRTRAPVGVAAVTLVTLLGVGGAAWLTLHWHPLWAAAAVSVGCLGVVGYGLYRYGLVSLGLVDHPERDEPRHGDAT